ncbi:hypothetical protein E1B28_013698 [Marasmius oreades]|uniref:Uncharacterized protein n=1 Tax=Marasmius oreades TaxID=181124 RepID=A0A9P7RQP8_9AGAR|nr:uncharacterized protein E1B28_013698 [Marasmius oreades]KAG7087757.1 hypothetical protein E1B28_013698 [Marasmius oreades]
MKMRKFHWDSSAFNLVLAFDPVFFTWFSLFERKSPHKNSSNAKGHNNNIPYTSITVGRWMNIMFTNQSPHYLALGFSNCLLSLRTETVLRIREVRRQPTSLKLEGRQGVST